VCASSATGCQNQISQTSNSDNAATTANGSQILFISDCCGIPAAADLDAAR
jgi:hypothetical protein